jgi:protein-S-isoprenylcysteine O-methyltransferase Ste14
MHIPPIFVYPEAIIFWIVFIWFFYLEFQHSRIVAGTLSTSQDAGTHRLINVGTKIALFLAFTVSFLPWFVISNQRIALDAGTGLLIVGDLFRQYCIRILGKCFTAAVIVIADQPVIEDGPYHWVRHPGYAAVFIVFLGIGFALGNWLSLIIFFIEVCFVYRRRVIVEEKALLNTIGEPYRAYMARTKRFIPFIF